MALDSKRFAVLWRRAGCSGSSALVFAALTEAYAQPHRHYHAARHIKQVLSEFDAVEVPCEDPVAVELALWFHDAVYDTRKKDNEEASAQWLESAMREAGARPAVWTRAVAHVRATAHGGAESTDLDTHFVLDCDLAILAAPARIFDQYDRQISEEYFWVPADDYRRERAKVLRGFLAQARIFRTPAFDDYETPANRNLVRALRRLESN